MTKIPWTDETWNPVTGCTHMAAGCKNCYAEKIARRFWGERKFTDVQCYEDRLEIPVHWKKPRKIFVCSMSDLFHEKVPFEFIDKVFDVIWQTNHTYQILTKRPKRILEYLKYTNKTHCRKSETEPKPKIWTGISISTQSDAGKNIPILLQIPAAVRFVSLEPILEQINFEQPDKYIPYAEPKILKGGRHHKGESLLIDIDWVIIGCESGPGARLCSLDDIRYVRDQCKEAGVPVFIKQITLNGKCNKYPDQWPEEFQIQEYPK